MNKQSPKTILTSTTFLICFIIAVLGWFVITFSREYVQTLPCEVVLYDIPENVKTISTSDSVVLITFKAKGFNYLKNSFTDKYTTLNLSITNLSAKKEKKNVYAFSKRELSSYIKEYSLYGNSFVEIEKPESLSIYIKR